MKPRELPLGVPPRVPLQAARSILKRDRALQVVDNLFITQPLHRRQRGWVSAVQQSLYLTGQSRGQLLVDAGIDPAVQPVTVYGEPNLHRCTDRIASLLDTDGAAGMFEDFQRTGQPAYVAGMDARRRYGGHLLEPPVQRA